MRPAGFGCAESQSEILLETVRRLVGMPQDVSARKSKRRGDSSEPRQGGIAGAEVTAFRKGLRLHYKDSAWTYVLERCSVITQTRFHGNRLASFRGKLYIRLLPCTQVAGGETYRRIQKIAINLDAKDSEVLRHVSQANQSALPETAARGGWVAFQGFVPSAARACDRSLPSQQLLGILSGPFVGDNQCHAFTQEIAPCQIPGDFRLRVAIHNARLYEHEIRSC